MSTPHNSPTSPSLAAGEFRMPAEWEPHAATWIAWPHNRNDWPGKITPIHWVYADIVRHLVPGERVRILVNSAAMEVKVRFILQRVGVDAAKVDFYTIPTNRSWIRDYGPIFVGTAKPNSKSVLMRFRFNAWAKYKNWQLDDQVPIRIQEQMNLPLIAVKRLNREVVLEGGSIDTNGNGTLVTTEECLLHPQIQVRNPDFTREDYESIFRDYLGISQVLWLGQGITGDDTHGHVDDLCRFVNPTTVVLCREENSQDADYRRLCENRERLQNQNLKSGVKLNIIDLPMPQPLYFDNRRLPASYANFYAANDAVLVPTFNDPQDRKALGVLAELFPNRKVIGIHAVDLVWGLGTLHCLTQSQPQISQFGLSNS